MMAEASAVIKQLFWDAAEVDAGSAQRPAFNDADAGARRSGHAGGSHAAGACPDDQQIQLRRDISVQFGIRGSAERIGAGIIAEPPHRLAGCWSIISPLVSETDRSSTYRFDGFEQRG